MDADLITSWTRICQELAPAFTRPTFVTFLHIVTGWVLCRSKPTVTSLICTMGQSLLGHVVKHWTVYERFFYRAAWSLQSVSQLLLTQVIIPLVDKEGLDGPGSPVELTFDGTTCARTGKHVAYAGYFKDASVGNAAKAVIHWAHNWLIGCVVLRPYRWPHWALALPVLFALYRKRVDCDKSHPFASTQQLAARMIQETRRILPEREIRACGDGQFASREVVAVLDDHSSLVSRIRSDAALYEVPTPPRKRRRGQPRKKGQRLPTPKKIARRRRGWRTIRVRKGGVLVKRRVLSLTCLWYHVARDQPIKLVIVRDPQGQERDDFFFCTDPSKSDTQIVERYYARWPIEESIRDGKQVGGFEQVQGWCPQTVLRQAPMSLVTQTLVKAWYLKHGIKAKPAQPKGADVCGWLGPKNHPTYLDMLATLRQVIWDSRIKINSAIRGRVGDILSALRFTLCGAA